MAAENTEGWRGIEVPASVVAEYTGPTYFGHEGKTHTDGNGIEHSRTVGHYRLGEGAVDIAVTGTLNPAPTKQ